MRQMRLISQILATIALCSAGAVQAANVRVTANPNPDGVYSEAFKCVASDRSDCAPPTTGTLTCDDSAAPSLVNLPTGTPVALDWRQYFGGTAAATATLSVVTVSGDNATTEGWAISSAGAGNNLTHPADQTGAGVLKVRGTTSGNPVDCGEHNWSLITPSGSDVTAPTVPTGLTATPANGTVELAWSASGDPKVGSVTASGVQDYDVNCASSIVATPSAAAGLSLPRVEYQIGSYSPTPTSSQSGSDWDLVSAGTGFTGSADQGFLLGSSLAGDFSVTAEIDALTTGLASAQMGIMIRESSANNAPTMFCFRSSDTDINLRCRARTAGGGSYTTLATSASTTLPTWFRLTRVGDSFTAYISTDGLGWGQIAQTTIPMASTVLAGAAISSQSGGNTLSGTVKQLSINNAPDMAYSRSASTAQTCKVRARDVAGNVSAYSATVTATPLVSGPLKKWHPGYYMLTSGTSSFTASHITDLSSSPNIIGVQHRIYWATLEPTQGNYDWSQIDSLISVAHSVGKKVFIQIIDRKFGSTNPSGAIPSYLSNVGGTNCIWTGTATNGTARSLSRLWIQECMDRRIALEQAMAARYDSNADFEGSATEETSLGAPSNSDTGYTTAAWVAQLGRLAAAANVAWPHTNVMVFTNFLDNQDISMGALFATLSANKVGVGGPDTTPPPHTLQEGGRVLTGVSAAGTHDYRGEVLVGYALQQPEMGGKDDQSANCATTCYDMSEHYAFIKPVASGGTLGANYWFPVRKIGSTNGGLEWADVKTFIDAGGHPLTTACPSSYVGCDTN